jgi:hypothetical protein
MDRSPNRTCFSDITRLKCELSGVVEALVGRGEEERRNRQHVKRNASALAAEVGRHRSWSRSYQYIRMRLLQHHPKTEISPAYLNSN